jgi:hypothetical protein
MALVEVSVHEDDGEKDEEKKEVLSSTGASYGELRITVLATQDASLQEKVYSDRFGCVRRQRHDCIGHRFPSVGVLERCPH